MLWSYYVQLREKTPKKWEPLMHCGHEGQERKWFRAVNNTEYRSFAPGTLRHVQDAAQTSLGVLIIKYWFFYITICSYTVG